MIKKRSFFRSLINTLSHFNFRRSKECSTLIRWLAAKSGEHILDVGCGDGYYDKLISKSGAKVIGIDIHKRRLSTAHHLYREKNTEFIFMDAAAMSFREASFEKVVSFCVVEHFYHDEQVIRNISRVLKPGGCFVFSADSLSNPQITAQERARHQHRYAVNTFYTKENVREKLFQAGFDIEKEQYLITTPTGLVLIRLSWKLDNLPGALAAVRVFGYLVLGVIWKIISPFAERMAVHSSSGLTLLIHAKKREAAGGNR